MTDSGFFGALLGGVLKLFLLGVLVGAGTVLLGFILYLIASGVIDRLEIG